MGLNLAFTLQNQKIVSLAWPYLEIWSIGVTLDTHALPRKAAKGMTICKSCPVVISPAVISTRKILKVQNCLILLLHNLRGRRQITLQSPNEFRYVQEPEADT